jgi:hypothetical protein
MGTTSIEQTIAIPVEPQRAFDVTLPIPLTAIFSRRFGLLPPIKEVRGQNGVWGQVGQTRTVVTTDGGAMLELLTEIDSPHSFSYLLSDISGPMGPLVDSIEGRWEFESQENDTQITWRWTLHTRGLGPFVMPLVTLMWHGYARRALERLSVHVLQADEA